MLAIERRRKIMSMLNENHSVLVTELAQLFNVTEETIRRDLEKLESEGLLKRTYGGAVLIESTSAEVPFSFREVTNIEGKRAIALKLVQYIDDGDTLVMDSSSSALQVAKLLKTKKGLTVITNSLKIINELSNSKDIKIISTGGTLRTNTLSLVGPFAIDTLNKLSANKAIISCKGFDVDKGFTESNELEAEVKIAMLNIAARKYFIVDHTKFNKVSLVKLIDTKKVNAIFADKNMSEKEIEMLNNLDVTFITC